MGLTGRAPGRASCTAPVGWRCRRTISVSGMGHGKHASQEGIPRKVGTHHGGGHHACQAGQFRTSTKVLDILSPSKFSLKITFDLTVDTCDNVTYYCLVFSTESSRTGGWAAHGPHLGVFWDTRGEVAGDPALVGLQSSRRVDSDQAPHPRAVSVKFTCHPLLRF